MRTISAIAALILVAGSCVAFKPGSTGYSATWLSVLGAIRLWTPAELDNVELWLDGSSSEYMTFTNSRISQWDDRSGSGNHATVVGTAYPSYSANYYDSLGSVRFQNATNLMEMLSMTGNATNMTTVGVWEFTTWTGVGGYALQGFTSGQNNRWYTGWHPNSGNIFWNIGVAGALDELFFVAVERISAMYGMTLSGGTGYAYYFGNLEASDSESLQGAPTRWRLGGGGVASMDGYISEIIHLNYAASDSDRQKIEGYLAHKWGLESRLPTNHPYKASAPLIGD